MNTKLGLSIAAAAAMLPSCSTTTCVHVENVKAQVRSATYPTAGLIGTEPYMSPDVRAYLMKDCPPPDAPKVLSLY